MNVYGAIENYLRRKKKGMIATVITRAGSAPRDVGAKMFIDENGKIYGTIGGGNMEYDICRRALLIMGRGISEIFHVRMNANEIASSGMICGGDVDVLLEPVLEKYETLYNRLEYLERSGKRGILVTRFNESSFTKTLIEDDMTVNGDSISDSERDIFLQHMRESKYFVTDGMVIEPLLTVTKLYIFGAGHVSQYIAKIAKMINFSVTVIDDREEFASKERFPDADEIIVEDFLKAFEKLVFTGKEFVVIVTRGHQHDAGVLGETLKKQTRYTGMIGSKRKVKMIFDHMRKSGFDEEIINTVHAPIGLSINAETPQEIAVSIVAELIKVRGE